MTARSSKQIDGVLADLRHMYHQMVNGVVKDSAQAKRIAEGLLGRAIEKLERTKG